MYFKIASFVALTIFITACSSPETRTLSDSEREAYMKKGSELVLASGGALISQLTQQIQKGGTTGAISFCNVNASKIIDSLSKAYNVEIRRTSLKYRNPNNKPDKFEKKVLKMYDYAVQKEEETPPKVAVGMDKNVLYFHPIFTNEFCMQCHGTKENGYEMETFEAINELYPKDKAFNYEVGDFRGLWVIEFKDSTSSAQ